jgi:hypothetical protein
MMRINVDAKLLLNKKNYILKSKRITTVETDQVKKISDLKCAMIQKTKKE